MRRRSRSSKNRNTLAKYLIYVVIIVLLFHTEIFYLLKGLWLVLVDLADKEVTFAQVALVNKFDSAAAAPHIFRLIGGGVFYYLALQIFGLFNSQFLLPVYSWDERVNVYRSFRKFLSSSHGPLIFVRDGEAISSAGEKEKSGAGVVLVTSNSAVVVGDQVHGPGIVFTDVPPKKRKPPKEKEPQPATTQEKFQQWLKKMIDTPAPAPKPPAKRKGGKKIGRVIDLRKQYREAKDVRAVTRDGIEVSTNISIQFSLSAPPEIVYVTAGQNPETPAAVTVLNVGKRGDVIVALSENDFTAGEQNEIYRNMLKLRDNNLKNLLFAKLDDYSKGLFIKERVQASFDNQPRNPSDGERIDWRELPLNIAMEEFRNAIVRYTFDDLIAMPNPSDADDVINQVEETHGHEYSTLVSELILEELPVYPLEFIRNEFTNRVRYSGFVAYQYVRKREDKPLSVGDRLSDKDIIVSPPLLLQSPQPLRRTQITVSAVDFDQIIPTNPEIRRQTVQNLVERWKSEAYKTEVGFEEQAAMIRSRAKAQSQQDTVYALRNIIMRSDKVKAALILRTFQALETAITDSDNKELVSMVKMLGDMRQWFNEKEKRGELPTSEPPTGTK